METTGFFVVGIVLVIAALVISAIGLRAESFPSRAALVGGTVVFLGLVLATTTFAVLNAREEQNDRADEAEGEESAAIEETPPPGTPAPPPGAKPETLKLTSPADGSLVFDPDTLDAKPGQITLEYENPSSVPHSIAVESSDGETIDASQPGTEGTFTATAVVGAGEYVFYCTVPGHRESGMEGTLTVK